MKFHQLSLGQPFEHQGKQFIKASPIIAWCDESGSQQIVPRSAEVQVNHPGDAISREQTPDIPLQHARQVLLKWHSFCADCLRSVADNPTADTLAEVRQQLDQAQARFLRELENTRHNHSREEQSK